MIIYVLTGSTKDVRGLGLATDDIEEALAKARQTEVNEWIRIQPMEISEEEWASWELAREAEGVETLPRSKENEPD